MGEESVDAFGIPKASAVTESTSTSDKQSHSHPPDTGSSKDWRFWTVIFSLCAIGFASSLDNTIIFTALPTITQQIGGGDQYVWIANSYALASVAIQPLMGQLADIFGRRGPMITSVALFTIGAGVAGGASSVAMLIAGRTVQGLGCGGIFVFMDIITCDLVSQRERGQYLGIVLSFTALGSTLGPVVGGALADANWRWVFFISLPFAGVTLVVMWFCLTLKYPTQSNWTEKLLKVDYIGNIIFIGSIVSLLLGLNFGSSNVVPWSSSRVVVPIVIGVVGWICFHIYEWSPLCKVKTVPPHLFHHRTTVIGFLLAFDFGMLLEWATYFLPVYFQALKNTSALISGVDTLPLNAMIMPAGMVGGVIMTKVGIYRPIHFVGFALISLGLGLFSILGVDSPTAMWVWWQFFVAMGLGAVFVTVLPAIQAPLADTDVASSTSFFSFMRSFGILWGATIPPLIFNSQIDFSISRVTDPAVQAMLANGGAYSVVTTGVINNLSPTSRAQAIGLFSSALKPVWYAAAAFGAFGCLLVLLEQHHELREEVNTEYGIAEDESKRLNKDRVSEEGKASV